MNRLAGPSTLAAGSFETREQAMAAEEQSSPVDVLDEAIRQTVPTS